MLMTGSPALRYSLFKRAMFSNWALRLGLRGPIVFFFNAFLLRYLCLRSNWDTTSRLTGVPNAVTRSAISFRDKFVHFTSARIGSPAVWSRSTLKKFGSRAASTSISFFRPPPFFGPDWCPSRLLLRVPPTPGGWSWDRTAEHAQCTRYHRAPASLPPRRHNAVDRSPLMSQRAASSFVRLLVNRRPCCPPWSCSPGSALDTINLRNRELAFRSFLSIHGLNRWTVNCLEMSRKHGVRTDKTPRARTEVLAAP